MLYILTQVLKKSFFFSCFSDGDLLKDVPEEDDDLDLDKDINYENEDDKDDENNQELDERTFDEGQGDNGVGEVAGFSDPIVGRLVGRLIRVIRSRRRRRRRGGRGRGRGRGRG